MSIWYMHVYTYIIFLFIFNYELLFVWKLQLLSVTIFSALKKNIA